MFYCFTYREYTNDKQLKLNVHILLTPGHQLHTTGHTCNSAGPGARGPLGHSSMQPW